MGVTECADEVSLPHYCNYLATSYPAIRRIHAFLGGEHEVPVVVCEVAEPHTDLNLLGEERWICENFFDIYLLAPGPGWQTRCRHLAEKIDLVRDRILHLQYQLAFDRDFGAYPFALASPL